MGWKLKWRKICHNCYCFEIAKAKAAGWLVQGCSGIRDVQGLVFVLSRQGSTKTGATAYPGGARPLPCSKTGAIYTKVLTYRAAVMPPPDLTAMPDGFCPDFGRLPLQPIYSYHEPKRYFYPDICHRLARSCCDLSGLAAYPLESGLTGSGDLARPRRHAPDQTCH